MSPASLPNPLSTLPHPALGATQGPGSCLSGLWRLCGENIYLAQPNEVYIAYLCIKFTIFGRYISKVLQFLKTSLKMELYFGLFGSGNVDVKLKSLFSYYQKHSKGPLKIKSLIHLASHYYFPRMVPNSGNDTAICWESFIY